MNIIPTSWIGFIVSLNIIYANVEAPIGSPKMEMATMLAFICFNAQLKAVCPISCGTMARRSKKMYECNLYPVNDVPDVIDAINKKIEENV